MPAEPVRPDGVTSYSMIQLASDSGNAAALVLFLFDLLYLDTSTEQISSHGRIAKTTGDELLVPPRRNSPRARHVVSAQGSTSSERH